MIWREPGVMFIHIPKTGGSSIEHMLHRSNLNKREGRVGQHSTLAQAYNITVDDPTDYLKFAVVRNPWDRILSYYLMCYKRNHFRFPQVDQFKDRKYVSFPEFYHNLDTSWLHVEDSFHYLAIDNHIPSDLHIIRFEHLVEDTVSLLREHEIDIPDEFPHINYNERATEGLRNYLKQDPEYAEVIAELYKEEIEYFNFSYNPHVR